MNKAKTYSVRKISEDQFPLSGNGHNVAWVNAVELTDFIYPWENTTPPRTSFKALHSNDWLYLLYNATDNNINIFIDKNEKDEVVSSDRVEIFFRIDDKLSPYYCLEVDPNGRILDYEARYHRNFERRWHWPENEIQVKTSTHSTGYIVELAISKKSLRELGVLNNGQLEAGVFRADCLAIRENEGTFKWISWVKPNSETPDFHIPSSFGLLTLEN